MASRKLVVVKYSGILPELGGIAGPILTPTRIPVDSIIKLIKNNKKVYAVDPLDPKNNKKWVELTLENVKETTFGHKEEKKPEAPKQEKKKAETVKPTAPVNTPKQEVPKQEEKKPEVTKPVTPVNNTPKKEEKKPEAPKQEEKKAETVKPTTPVNTPKQEEKKPQDHK